MQPATTIPKDQASGVPPSEVIILSKVFLRNGAGLTRDQALYLAGLGFSDEDKDRIRELARKNREGTISPEELRELDNYVKVGDLLAILQSKARNLLKTK